MKIKCLYFSLFLNFVYADNGINPSLNSPTTVQALRNSGNQFSYGSNGQAISNTQRLGSQTNFYNNSGQNIGKAQTSPNGSVYYYNSNGQITGYSLK